MRRRILATALAGGALASGAWLVMPAGAATTPCTPTALPTPATGDSTQGTPDGGTIFYGGSASGGEAGIEGPHGYLSANGGTNGGSIQGNSADAPVNGKATVSSSPSVCVNGTSP